MGAQQKRPLRQLTQQEREELSQKATSISERVSTVKKAKALLAVADGWTFTGAGRQLGMSRDGVSQLVERFHQRGVEALLDCSRSWPQADLYQSGSPTDSPRNTASPHLGRRSMYCLVTSPFAKVLACQRIFRYLPKNDPSSLAGAWMEVPADNTHLAPH